METAVSCMRDAVKVKTSAKIKRAYFRGTGKRVVSHHFRRSCLKANKISGILLKRQGK